MVEKSELTESIFDMDLDTLIPESNCNTRKESFSSNICILFYGLYSRRRTNGQDATL